MKTQKTAPKTKRTGSHKEWVKSGASRTVSYDKYKNAVIRSWFK